MITKKQKQVFDFVKAYCIKHDYAPSLEEIKRRFELASVSTAHYYVKKLQEAGQLQKEFNQPRAIVAFGKKQTMEIPILGVITAGQPIEAVEVPNETITITKDEIGKDGKHYALRVQGSSMIEEGIFDGDIVVIRKQEVAENGQTVVAIIDENEATLKKFYRENNKIRLQPANPRLFPIYRDEVEIRGVVVKIIRNLELQLDKEKSKDKYVRRIDYSWDYRGENTKTYTHGIHTYPAMFIPQVARRLLETYSKEGDTICDIFCGSGTALVESKVSNRNAYGIDLNPLAIFLAKAKTTAINPQKLTKIYMSLLDRIGKVKDSETKSPNFKNIDFWFKEKVIAKLSKLKKAIQEIGDETIRNFLMVPFSETVRCSSNTKTGEFKLVRIKSEKLDRHDPDVFGIFRKKAEADIVRMGEFYKDAKKDAWIKIIYGDSSEDNGVKPSSVDCIITSPPYGDSRTTVAYGQFSRLSAQWADIFDNPNDASGVDNKLLGGRASKTLTHSLLSDYLNDSLDKIAKKDEARAKDVLSFYIGLNKCLKQSYKILKPKKYFCIVIGNRLVKQVRIPTDFIIAELGEKIGFTCEDIFVRNIPGKRMPIKNSPTNIVGVLEETMNKESVVVLRKS
ncbi:MAG: transcriptional repressor LexA [Candidatus Sungbacteria bacterium]|uniref:LexA repressor n=1 Tax=Candidatus Sungiibacteriota bacterium TaxID=2750080 RepID=A0A931YDI9_9BACT|nr:transcriptional repressor LexA [Candidatus Sungbacteria bacterium]